MAGDVLNDVIHEIKMRLRDYVTDVRGKKITSTGHFKCPITFNHKHGDTNPSCHIDTRSDGTGVWYCHTCQTGGSIYDLLYHEENMPIDGPAFLEATSYLAQKLNIFFDIDILKNADYTKYDKQSETLEIYQDIEKYLIEHGNPIESLADADFGRGYSKEQAEAIMQLVPLGSVDNDELFKYLEDKYGEQFINSTLNKYNKAGTVFGKNTLTMSYRDQRGNPIRFIGRYRNSYREESRVDDQKIPKYIQTTGLFGKTKEVPFLLNVAQDEIKRTRKAIITEGEYDALAMHLMGFKNTIASRGASITDRFIDLLFHMKVTEVTLVFDNDFAALNSILKYYKYFSDNGMALYVVQVEEGYDPDRYIREGECIDLNTKIDAVEYLLRNHWDFADTSIPEQVRYHNCIVFLAENIVMQSYQQKYCEEILSPSFGFHGDLIFADIRNYTLGLETKDVRVKKIHEEVESVKNSPIMDRISRYESGAEQLRNIVSEKGMGIAQNTYNTFRALKKNDMKLPKRLITGDTEFDDQCTLLTSTVSTWAGWPSNGKTTTIRNIGLNIIAANAELHPIIVHFSLDDDDRNSILNYTSMLTHVPPAELRAMLDGNRWFGGDVAHEYDVMLDQTFKNDIHVFNSMLCPDVSSACRIMNTMKSAYPDRTMFVIVDALNNFVDFNKDNQISAAEGVVRELKRAAVRYDAHVAIVAHFKKHPGDSRRPRLSDLKGTSFLEHEAQNIFLMYMEAHYNKNDSKMVWFDESSGESLRRPVIEIDIAKDKNHRAATVIPYNFNTRDLRLFTPTIADMDRYREVLEKL